MTRLLLANSHDIFFYMLQVLCILVIMCFPVRTSKPHAKQQCRHVKRVPPSFFSSATNFHTFTALHFHWGLFQTSCYNFPSRHRLSWLFPVHLFNDNERTQGCCDPAHGAQHPPNYPREIQASMGLSKAVLGSFQLGLERWPTGHEQRAPFHDQNNYRLLKLRK